MDLKNEKLRKAKLKRANLNQFFPPSLGLEQFNSLSLDYVRHNVNHHL